MFEPLLADVDWGKIAILIIFVLGPLLGQLFKADPKAAPPRRQPRPGLPPQPPRKALEQEIADFLRQAQHQANRPKQPPPRAEPQPMPARTPAATFEPTRPARRQLRNKPTPPRSSLSSRPGPQAPTPQEQAPRPRRRPALADRLGQHVSEHLDTSSIAEKTESLGSRVRVADEEVEQHLHQTFDHQLGELDTGLERTVIREGTDDASWQDLSVKSQQEAQARAWQALDIIRMLRDPSAVREAIVLGEVLQPPITQR